MVRVKICGITRPQEVAVCADAGADALGLNFLVGPRKLTLNAAAELIDACPAFVTPVALVPATKGQVDDDLFEFLGARWIDHLQLYGDVTPALVSDLRSQGFAPILPRPVGGPDWIAEIDGFLAACAGRGPAALLLDTMTADQPGGTGRPVDWQAIADAREQGLLDRWPPLILAGGLTPDNVADAIRTVRPYAVDVCTGVESAPGIKDADKVRAFIQAARTQAPPSR